MLINLKSLSPVLVMISSNHFTLHACVGLLEPRGSGLELLKSTLSAENFIAGCLGLSPAISSQFSVELCAASKKCQKITKNFFEGFKVVQGHRCS